VYNGVSDVSPSHRARIPGYTGVTFRAPEEDVLGFGLFLDEATFRKRSRVGNGVIEQTTYAHRVRQGLVVSTFCLLEGSEATIDLRLLLLLLLLF
jgi:hypothetical protein